MPVLKLKNKNTKKWEDVTTIKGDVGDMPAHEIDGTKIRFQNPDGSWGEWIELEVLTAENVPTDDGSNVRDKLNNTFSLGLDESGKLNEQNANGLIVKNGVSVNDIKYTGKYYCINCTQRPTSVNGHLEVSAYSDINIIQRYTNNTATKEVYERIFIDGAWGTWNLVSGDSGWLTIAGQPNTKYRRKNGIVFINFQVAIAANITVWTNLFTLPEGYRPDGLQVFGVLHANSSSGSISTSINILINTSGVIQYMNPNVTSGYIGSVSFPTV